MFFAKSYIYRFLDANEKIIYVGKTNNLDRRYTQHFSKKGHLPRDCYNSVWKIEYIKTDTELNALLLETYYINKYRPQYNKLNKTYKATSTENVNLKEIKDNWKVYKIVNPLLNTNKQEGRRLTLKENIVFYSLTLISLAIFTVIYCK
ncbi:nucleotide excision repair endonuclease (plasmid) [Paraclostridium bifermentans]|uniref:Nucleotide excision repair endonuclease n=1 Tax=Paraclostridium bifermentans TaxID=1490 RepID=A0ABY8R7Z1_PARBF|nr:nucleotide excision repair endonuclease [Paraclostridium bifermentans]